MWAADIRGWECSVGAGGGGEGGGQEVAASEDTERTKNKVQSYFSVRAEVGVC